MFLGAEYLVHYQYLWKKITKQLIVQVVKHLQCCWKDYFFLVFFFFFFFLQLQGMKLIEETFFP